jgi:3-oxoacyl-[acyl-carrier protein] reductase
MSEMRIVLVTGGGSGMGRAIVERFAENGDVVYAMGRREQPLETLVKKFPKNVRALQGDVTDSKSLSNAVEVLYKAGKGLDVLVNCAGSAGHIEDDLPLGKALEQWNKVIAVNLSGTFLTTYAFLPLIRKPGGRIINITSTAAFAGSSRPGGEAYAAAKAGIHGLTRTLVRQLGPKGITVNCVSPGVVQNTEFFGGVSISPDRAALMLPFIPAGRLGKPEDVAAAVFYVASNEAGYVNGDILNVNGGQQFGR